MDVNVNEIVFEPSELKESVGIPETTTSERTPLIVQLLNSDYVSNNGLVISKFLDANDKTIDLEKLELAISLMAEFLLSMDDSNQVQILYLRGMDEYFRIRNIDGTMIDRVIEESSFIMGFCRAILIEEAGDRMMVSYDLQR